MKKMKNNSIDEFEEGESYLVFMGFEYSSSGFDIALYLCNETFELQSNGEELEWTDRIEFYKLPKK